MTELESWLHQATRHLSRYATAQVRTEIEEHCDATREAARNSGASAEEADQRAVLALGDAKAANRQYRRVLLTSFEARMLRDAQWEARAVCSRPWLKWLLLAMPVAALLAAGWSFLLGTGSVARVLLAGGIGLGLLLTALFLPVYTPSRARIYRRAKWAIFAAMFALAFGPDTLHGSWLLASCCLWPLVWIEWTRASVRRKLRVAEWPKALYL